MASSTGRPHKRHRRGPRGDTVEDFHKERAAREAERNAETKKQAQEVSKLLKDERELKAEIEKLKQDKEKDHSSAIRALEGSLSKHQQDTQRRLSKQELDSEIALKRKIAAGITVGPAPPSSDPPRRGPGFPPPRPPPYRERPAPPPPPRHMAPIQPLLPNITQPVLMSQAATRIEPVKEEEPSRPHHEEASGTKKLFMPTSVAVNIKRNA